jgi:hypothetical protein
VHRVHTIARDRVRANFEMRFSAARQAEDYEQLYRHLIQARRSTVNRSANAVVPLLHAA